MESAGMSKAERAEYDEELRTLIGDNFLAYDHLMMSLADINQLPVSEQRWARAKRLNFERSAFLGLILPISYFWYRKLWLDGLMITGIWFAIAGAVNAFIAEGATLVFHIILGIFTMLFGKEYVMERYRVMIAQARSRIPDREERLAYLAERGGTSSMGGAIPYILFACLLLLAYLLSTGQLGSGA